MLRPVLSTELAALTGIRHGFFTREGGVSTGIYASLNCGLGSKDERPLVLDNRARVAQHLAAAGERPGLGLAARLVTVHQVHSATAIIIDRAIEGELPKADGLVTLTPGLVIGALAADCAPILFADAKARVVGAAHAGWRGALGGVIEATVAAMVEAGAARDRIVAAVGPCIGQASYEVGPEFEKAFLDVDASYGSYFLRGPAGARPHFDLPGFVLGRMRAAGLGQCVSAHRCTYAEPERFFSYRRATHRGEADYGRQVSAIMVT